MSIFLLGLVIELIRRKKLKEKYALGWLFSACILLVFSLWRNLIDIIAKMAGIFYAPAVLLPVVILLGTMLFLYFSVVITKLTEDNKRLFQELGLLRQKIEIFLEKEQGKND